MRATWASSPAVTGCERERCQGRANRRMMIGFFSPTQCPGIRSSRPRRHVRAGMRRRPDQAWQCIVVPLACAHTQCCYGKSYAMLHLRRNEASHRRTATMAFSSSNASPRAHSNRVCVSVSRRHRVPQSAICISSGRSYYCDNLSLKGSVSARRRTVRLIRPKPFTPMRHGICCSLRCYDGPADQGWQRV